MRIYVWLLALGCSGTVETPAPAVDTAVVEAPEAPPVPDNAVPGGAEKRVFFVEPVEGATVNSPVKVVFGIGGMEVAPAGEVKPDTGHHHLIIDAEPVAAGTVVPADEKHIHFGKGQTETTVELPSGPHTLTLQFADGAHGSYGEAMSATIHIIVN